MVDVQTENQSDPLTDVFDHLSPQNKQEHKNLIGCGHICLWKWMQKCAAQP